MKQRLSNISSRHIRPEGQEAEATSVATATSSASGTATNSITYLTPAQKALIYPKAPELAGIDGYLNTGGQPVTLAQYQRQRRRAHRLLDVQLYQLPAHDPVLSPRGISKYKGEGLVIIGVHTPEFAFEHVEQNVAGRAHAAWHHLPGRARQRVRIPGTRSGTNTGRTNISSTLTDTSSTSTREKGTTT
jgi:hypothetical protein